MGMTIATINQKGGAGKTTTAIELSYDLAEFERKVLLIDIDSQVGLTYYVPVDPSMPTIYDVLHANKKIDDAIQHLDRIDVITASEELSKADKEFVDYDDIFLLKDIVDVVRDRYDYIVIDTGPHRNILLNMTYVASDYIIVPIAPDKGNIEGINKVYKDIEQLRGGKRPISSVEIAALLLTQHRGGHVNDQVKLEAVQTLASEMKEKPMVAYIRGFTGVNTCKDFQQPIKDFDKNSNAAIDYRNFTWDLMQRLEGKDE
ncbi:MAG: ParA family protein [Butyrivibrio sp.]|uniref:ParA family protein n=1 Tax=Butyrivibrio sp. TaxID=28121 RepID=UPI001B7139AD|nr:ParA family protein [Butyrivibrio sp.]MBP3784558.1 ParA family protein [Butyrivibrio sp.]